MWRSISGKQRQGVTNLLHEQYSIVIQSVYKKPNSNLGIQLLEEKKERGGFLWKALTLVLLLLVQLKEIWWRL